MARPLKNTLAGKLGYASGTLSFAVKDVAFGSFVLFYYTSVVGLKGSLAGLVLFIAMVWDAVTDPVVGSISDNLRTRWGRRHALMAISGVPLAICLFALFNVPDGLDQTEIFLWMLVVCLLLRTFLTLFTIPYLALGAELSTDYQERSSIAGVRTLIGWLSDRVGRRSDLGHTDLWIPGDDLIGIDGLPLQVDGGGGDGAGSGAGSGAGGGGGHGAMLAPGAALMRDNAAHDLRPG